MLCETRVLCAGPGMLCETRLLCAGPGLLCQARLLCAGPGLLCQARLLREGLRLRKRLRLRFGVRLPQRARCRVALRRLHREVQDLHPLPEPARSGSSGCGPGHPGARSGCCPEDRRCPVAGRSRCEENQQRRVRLSATRRLTRCHQKLPGSNLGQTFFLHSTQARSEPKSTLSVMSM